VPVGHSDLPLWIFVCEWVAARGPRFKRQGSNASL
jgi:hypothetical protein